MPVPYQESERSRSCI